MHELSIALDLIDVAAAEMARLGPVHVMSVRLRVGPLSGVVKEALIFSFDTAILGTPLDGARLHIDDVPVSVWCDTCDAERDLPDLSRRRCPICEAPTPRVVRGNELELIGLEIQDA
jgi:hydrogenase nickel incorporation protein HypA/HybF